MSRVVLCCVVWCGVVWCVMVRGVVWCGVVLFFCCVVLCVVLYKSFVTRQLCPSVTCRAVERHPLPVAY